jgi:glycosyltransferase involved in cell wall biosynthesis
MEKIAVLIPCYNEELTIEKVIKDFKRELPDADIYVYNNNSKDKTEEIARKNGAIVVNEYKQGKGNVVRSQFRDIDADIYVMVDGDDTYPAEFIHKLIEPVKNGQADMAIGDRLSNGTYQKENKRPFHEFGNNLVKKAINILFDTDLKDIMTGYRVFNKRFVKNMPVLSPKFEIETEMSLYALDKKYIIKEIPIEYRDRPEGSSSKLNTVSDGIKVVKTIARMFKDYRPFKFFGIIALIFFALGLLVGIPVLVEFFKTTYITKVPSAILATGCMSLASVAFQCGIILDTITRQHREDYEINLLRYEQIEEMKGKYNNTHE